MRMKSMENAAKTSLMKSLFRLSLKIALMAGILFYLYDKGLLDFSRVLEILTTPTVALVGFSAIAFTTTLGAYRWSLLLKGQGIFLSGFEVVRLTMIGNFFNTALPGAVSGDVVKGYYIVRQQPDKKGKSKAFATLFFDRILGVSGLILVSFLAMLTHLKNVKSSPQLSPLIGLIGFLALGALVFYAFVLFDTPIARGIQKFLERMPGSAIWVKIFAAVKCYENNPGLIIKGFCISVLIHTCIVGLFLLLSHHLTGFEFITASDFFLLVPLGLVVTAIPIAPAGLGTGHAAFLGLFQLVGSKNGADLFTAFVAFQILVNLLGGAVYLRYRKTAPADISTMQPSEL